MRKKFFISPYSFARWETFFIKSKTHWIISYQSWNKRLEITGNWQLVHCEKSVRIWSYSGPHFPTFGLNYGVTGIRSISPYLVQMRENADQNDSEYRHFSRSGNWKMVQIPHSSWWKHSINWTFIRYLKWGTQLELRCFPVSFAKVSETTFYRTLLSEYLRLYDKPVDAKPSTSEYTLVWPLSIQK